MRILISIFLVVFLFQACSDANKSRQIAGDVTNSEDLELFRKVPNRSSGISFVNQIKETPKLNYFTYRHMYIGGGVATADFNNDGLVDIYFTANMSPNKLYLNEGDLSFRDITASAGVEGNTGFYMGVTVVDINNDGWMDIYLCKSGKYREPKYKENLLYVNNGDLTFTEKAAEYGLNDSHQSVQASFFDYDLDGDLDVYVVNTPVDFTISQKAVVLEYIYSNPKFLEYKGNDHLYRNDNGKFTEVSKASGILPDLAFGLNVSVSDFNSDGYPDIFVSNDFVAPDYLYINNADGTFTESAREYLRHTSFYSMGSDPSDINNDGLPDLMVLDMNPEDYERSKTTMEMMDRKLFREISAAGYNNIYMHNMLHLNTGMNSFKEISQVSGVANTDWSWSSLLADFDNDGFKDLHITNGIYRDVLDRDLRNEWNDYVSRKGSYTAQEQYDYLKSFPSNRLPNYIFRNTNGYHFKKLTDQWGMSEPTFSNGSALADFDNDGDLDLVINNLMDTASIYENRADQLDNNFVRVRLKGSNNNRQAIGARLLLKNNDQTQMLEVFPTRGYLSASTDNLLFGLGKAKSVDHLKVIWPDGKVSELENPTINKVLEINYSEAEKINESKDSRSSLMVKVEDLLDKPFSHTENFFDDYNIQVLLPYKYSQLGPSLSVGDVNGDQLDDFYVGGAAGQSGALYLQNSLGKFEAIEGKTFIQDRKYEDVGSEFIDFDNDGDLDLYVASGDMNLKIGRCIRTGFMKMMEKEITGNPISCPKSPLLRRVLKVWILIMTEIWTCLSEVELFPVCIRNHRKVTF